MTPPEGAAPDAATLLARVDAKAVAYWTFLGIVVDRTDVPGEVTLRLPMQPALGTRRPEVMHGGAIASLIDACAGAAVISLFGGDEDYGGQATLDLNVTFLSAATSDAIAQARVLRSSRTLAFTQVDVTDASGALLAVGRATYTIIRKR